MSTTITFTLTEDQIETLANHFDYDPADIVEDEGILCELLDKLIDEAVK